MSLSRRRPIRLLLAAAAISAAAALAGCNYEGIQISEKHLQPIPAATVALMEAKGMTKESPILIRVFKEESELEVWKQDATGQFALLKTFPICRWSGELGPKTTQGDRQAPEGFYTINPALMNPNSAYYLSFNLGYPNAYDRSHGRTGAHLMVHGNCSSAGCYSMTDEQIGEIFALGREAFFGGQKTWQVQAYPFRMTPLNMAKHRNSPHLAFWKMLKQGNDHFEATRQQPKVDVCDRRYVFNAEAPGNMSTPLKFDAAGKCPAFEVPAEVAAAVAAKQQRDEAQFTALVNRGTPTVPVKMGQDGGMHPVFYAKLNPQQVRDEKGNVRWIVENPPIGTRIAPVTAARDPANEIVAPVRTAEAAAAPATATTAVAYVSDVPMPRAAPHRPAATASFASAESSASASGNMFTNLFSNSTTSSVVRALGFGSEEAKPVVARPISAPQPATRPAPKPTAVAHGAPKHEPEKLKQTAEALPPRQSAEATPTPSAAPASLMSGAAPIAPAGNFENRWGAFR